MTNCNLVNQKDRHRYISLVNWNYGGEKSPDGDKADLRH